MTAPTVPDYPYIVWQHGERVTPRHALDGERGVEVCDCHELCGALVVADGPLAGVDVDRVEHEAKHRRAS